MFGIRKRPFAAPWFIHALANLTAVLLIYKIARAFTAIAGKPWLKDGAGKKNKKRRGRIVIKI